MKKLTYIASTFLLLLVTSGLLYTFTPFLSTISSQSYPHEKDADIPGMLKKAKSKFTKEQFQRGRAEGVALKRGIVEGQEFDPALRPVAIEKMEKQEELIREMPESILKDDLLIAWTPLGPAPIPNGQTSPTAPVSGRVTAIAIHPTNANIVYVGAAQGGVYRSTDGGTNWTPIFDNAQSLAIGALALAPSSPDTLYVGTGEPNFSIDSYFGVGVYRIDNASTTATLNGPFNQDSVANDVFSGRSVSEILVHPTLPGTIFVSTTSGLGGIRPANSAFPSRGIYRSTNATSGSPTFFKLTGLAANINASVRDLAIDPTDANVLVAVLVAGSPTGGIYRSANALAASPTFTQTLQFTGAFSTSSLTGELASQRSLGDTNATFYAGTGFGGGRVYRSLDGGVNWTLQIDNNFCGGQCFYDIAIAVDPTNAANVYLGGDPTIISASSTNSGLSFTDNSAGVHVDTHAMEVAPSTPSTIYLGTDGGIYKSTDSGATWTSLNNSQFSATQFMSLDLHPTDPNFSLGGTQDNGTNFYQ
ncbi:MAG: hypothetical protein HKN33_02685, partial [Pyrinomonadaceae bacterium]|nr:hypothetical protein [Pyrinomonadaceae bacterium]